MSFRDTLIASADLESRAIVKKQLHLDNESPNRTNIRLGLRRVSDCSLNCLDWLVSVTSITVNDQFSVLLIYNTFLETYYSCSYVLCYHFTC